MQSAAQELQAVTDSLDLFLLNGTSPVPALAAQLTNLSASISLAPFDSSTLSSLSTAQVLLAWLIPLQLVVSSTPQHAPQLPG
jgi:hypothetical protein